jgi:hypothetical protein
MTDTLTAAMVRHLRPPPPVGGVQLMRNAGLDPDPWQIDYLEQKPRRHIMVCSRQSGKSTTTAADALSTALAIPDSTTLLVAPAQRQAILLLRKVRRFAFAQRPALKMQRVGEQTLQLANGSYLVALPGKDETIRGYDAVSLILADEAAWIPQTLIEAVRPMLGVSNGRLVLLGTLWFTTGWFYEAWEDSANPGSQWTRTKIPATECPRLTPEFLEEERRSMPESVFMREYMCEATDIDGSIFARETIDAAVNETMTSEW